MRKDEQILITGDVARLADCSPDAVRRAERRGEIRAVKSVRGVRFFTEAEARRWLRRRQQAAAEAVLNVGNSTAA